MNPVYEMGITSAIVVTKALLTNNTHMIIPQTSIKNCNIASFCKSVYSKISLENQYVKISLIRHHEH